MLCRCLTASRAGVLGWLCGCVSVSVCVSVCLPVRPCMCLSVSVCVTVCATVCVAVCVIHGRVAGLRTLLRAMGAPTRGRNVVIKFQSAMLRHNHLIRRAFPSTPWVFLFRAPGEVMASLLFKNGARPSHSAPCLRSQRWPPVGIQQVLGMDAHQASRAAPTQYCAAHLALLMHYGVDGLNASLVCAATLSVVVLAAGS